MSETGSRAAVASPERPRRPLYVFQLEEVVAAARALDDAILDESDDATAVAILDARATLRAALDHLDSHEKADGPPR